MRRVLILFIVLLFAGATQAQEYSRAIGVRVGSSVGASYKQFLQHDRAFEGILDLGILEKGYVNLKVTGIYQFYFDIDVDGLSWYAGPGASLGLYVGDHSGFLMAIDGMVGIEYKFYNAPVAISFDWNPKVQLITKSGFKPLNFGMTFRYTL